MLRSILISAAVLFVAPMVGQTNTDLFCKIGSFKKKGTIYESVYTALPRTEAIQEALAVLIRENKSENKIILLYDNKSQTPVSNGLANKKIRENKNLLGGIEKTKKGNYYMLLYITEGMPLYRKKMN